MDGSDPDAPLDDIDALILGDVRRLWESADPMPDMVIDMIDFAFDLVGPDTEFLRTGVRHELAAARGDDLARLITFDGATLTIMINITVSPDGSLRVDGWTTPAVVHSIDLRTTTETRTTSSDSAGRFAFASVDRGMVQLVVRNGGVTTTPSIVL